MGLCLTGGIRLENIKLKSLYISFIECSGHLDITRLHWAILSLTTGGHQDLLEDGVAGHEAGHGGDVEVRLHPELLGAVHGAADIVAASPPERAQPRVTREQQPRPGEESDGAVAGKLQRDGVIPAQRHHHISIIIIGIYRYLIPIGIRCLPGHSSGVNDLGDKFCVV